MKKFIPILISCFLVCGLAFSQNIKIGGILDYGTKTKSPYFVQNTLVNVTNTSVDTTVATVSIPGNSIGSNGLMRITWMGDADANNANAKFFILRYGGVTFKQVNIASAKSVVVQECIWNRNNPFKQIGHSLAAATSYGTMTIMPLTNNVDTTASQTLSLSISNAVSTDSMNLQSFSVTIMKKD